MRGVLIIISLILAFSSDATCQVEPEWFIRGLFPGYASSSAYNIETDDAGNIYAMGVKNHEVPPEGTIFLMKYNSEGAEIWTIAFSEPDLTSITPYDLTIDDDNNLIICYYIYSTPKKIAIQKHDGNTGQILWTTTLENCQFNGFEWRVRPKYLTTNNNDIYAVGSTYTPDIPGSSMILVKLNTSGDTLWTRCNQGSNTQLYTNAKSVHTDTQGNVYVAGDAWNASIDYILVKYDNDGNLQWEQFLDGEEYSGTDVGEQVITSDDGSVYITGYSMANEYQKDILTAKYDVSGNLQWSRRYGTPEYSSSNAYYLDLTPDNHLVVGGYSAYENPYPGSGKDFIILKYNQYGDLIWDARWDHNNNIEDHPSDFDMDSQGNIYICGITKKDCYIEDFITVIKCNQQGEFEWNNWYPHLYGIPWEISVTGENKFVVAAQSYDTIMVPEATIVSYAPGASPGYEAKMLDVFFNSQTALPDIDEINHRVTCFVHDTADLSQLIPHISISEHACMYPSSGIPTNFAVPVWYNITSFDEEESVWWIVYVEGGHVGNKSHHMQDFQVYPNPASNQVMVSFPWPYHEKCYIEIYDITKGLVYSDYIEENSCRKMIKTNDLSQGLYMIHLFNNQYNKHHTLMIYK